MLWPWLAFPLDAFGAALRFIVGGNVRHDEAFDKQGLASLVQGFLLMNPGKTIPQGLDLFRLEARRGDERRHGRPVGGGDDAHLRGEGRVAGANQVPDVAIERADVDVARHERLDDAARVHQATGDLPVSRYWVFREEQG